MATETERPERCETCRFSDLDGRIDQEPGLEVATCRRYPPKIISALVMVEAEDDDDGIHQRWDTAHKASTEEWNCQFPRVFFTSWCGEFQPKQAAPKVALPMVVDESRWDEFYKGLPQTARWAISANRIFSFADLVRCNEADLLAMPKFGDVKPRKFRAGTVACIRLRLAEFGIKLRGE